LCIKSYFTWINILQQINRAQLYQTSRSTTVKLHMISSTCRTEKAGHTPCANFTDVACVFHEWSAKPHKPSLSGVVLVQFRPVIQNQLNPANIPVFWPAVSHPVVLQTTILHILLTAHSVTRGHSQIKKTPRSLVLLRHEIRTPEVSKIILEPHRAPLPPFQD